MNQIRPALPEDIAPLLALWNPIIRNTTVTFASAQRDVAGLTAYVEDRRARGRETFVALVDGVVAGFASYDQFRGGDGYVHAMEHTVILGAAARGQGLGRALMQAVESHARERGAHIMVAGISGENAAGIAFHQAMGYDHVGRMPQAGRKFGRWLDLVLMQKTL